MRRSEELSAFILPRILRQKHRQLSSPSGRGGGDGGWGLVEGLMRRRGDVRLVQFGNEPALAADTDLLPMNGRRFTPAPA